MSVDMCLGDLIIVMNSYTRIPGDQEDTFRDATPVQLAVDEDKF